MTPPARVALVTGAARGIGLAIAQWGRGGLRGGVAVHTPAIRAGNHAAIPLGRYGTPREIAEAVGFLCGDAAAYVNGQALAVDGGFDATGIGLNDLAVRGGSG